jgi:DNA invertase Pin-like site-specific DNA recombinase
MARVGGSCGCQRIGHVRVRTLDQNEKRQLDGLVLDRVFTDKASGRDTARPQLAELLSFARDGDTMVVHGMDRLARNLDDLRALVQGLARKGGSGGVRQRKAWSSQVRTPPMANLMLSVMGAFAEFRTCPHQGTPAGRDRPDQAARRVQRAEEDPHTGTCSRAGTPRRQRISKVLLAREYGISRETVYQYLRQARPAGTPPLPCQPSCHSGRKINFRRLENGSGSGCENNTAMRASPNGFDHGSPGY